LPLVHFTLPLVDIQRLPPTYSRALAKLKSGKFNEAEWEVIRELEKYEDNFEGWMMLAELYAVHFRDLAVAEQTIRDLCEQPNLNASQIAVALHRLAGWCLKVGEDPVAARRALQEICRRFPGTHIDRMARLRLSRLPATREALRAEREGKPLRLPTVSRSPDEPAAAPWTGMNKEQAAARARQCVEQLKQDPNNVPAREELAGILGDCLAMIGPALKQLELLLALPDPPEPKRAEWLGRMAAWQLQGGRDPEAARILMERLVREYPRLPQAFTAQRRLALMAAEERFRKISAATPPSRPQPEG